MTRHYIKGSYLNGFQRAGPVGIYPYKTTINHPAYAMWVDWYFKAPENIGQIYEVNGAFSLSTAGTVDPIVLWLTTTTVPTLSTAGTNEAGGILSSSMGDVTLVSAGVLTSAESIGTLSQSIGDISLSSAGVQGDLVGDLSKSIGDITLSTGGSLWVAGTLSQSMGTIAVSTAGVVSYPDLVGTLSQSIGLITLSTEITYSNLYIMSDLTNYVIVEDEANKILPILDFTGEVSQNSYLTTEVMIYDEIC